MPFDLLWSHEFDFAMRLLLSSLSGFLIGLEREKRLKNAGVRTHIIVAISAALMMIVSKYGFFDILDTPGLSVDASRIAAGVVTAIGFLGAGVIYVRKENTVGLTTAAGLWATVGIGIAFGAGMYVLGGVATVMLLLIQFVLHHRKFKLALFVTATVTVDLEARNMTFAEVKEWLSSLNCTLIGGNIDVGPDGPSSVKCNVIFPWKKQIERTITLLSEKGVVSNVEMSSVQ